MKPQSTTENQQDRRWPLEAQSAFDTMQTGLQKSWSCLVRERRTMRLNILRDALMGELYNESARDVSGK